LPLYWHQPLSWLIYILIELARLLSTAKDQNRQDLILKAIHALDEQEVVEEGTAAQKLNFHGMSPSMHASLFLGENVWFLLLDLLNNSAIIAPTLFVQMKVNHLSISLYCRCLHWKA
jgi:hypothetical protein